MQEHERRRLLFLVTFAVLFSEDSLSRKLDTVLFVDRNHFDIDPITDLDDVRNILHKAVCQLADVTETVFAGSCLTLVLCAVARNQKQTGNT